MRKILVLIVLYCGLGVLPAAGARLLDGVGEVVLGTEGRFGSAQDLRLDDRQLALSEIDELWLGPELQPPPRLSVEVLCAVLVDGSWLPVEGVGPSTRSDRVILRQAGADLELELGRIVAWGPRSWLTQFALAAPRQDQVRFGNEQLDGEVRGITEGHLIMASKALGEIRKPLPEIRAVSLAVPREAVKGLHLAVVLGAGLPPLRLLPTMPLRLAAAPVDLPGVPAQALQVLGGRRVWLSDLAPATVEEKGAFARTWNYQRDRDLDGQTIVIDGLRSEKGLVLHSRAVLSWKLDRTYAGLVTRIGIVDTLRPEGDVAVRIRGDDQTLFSSPSINGRTPGQELRLDLRGVANLTVEVDFGANHDIGDHLALAGAFLIKAR